MPTALPMNCRHVYRQALTSMTSNSRRLSITLPPYARILPVNSNHPHLALMGMTEEQMKAKPSAPMPVLLLQALICSFLISLVLALIINHFPPYHPLHGALAGFACWLGFAASTSYATAVFSLQPKALWLINSGYNLVSFVMAGAILGAWR